MKINHLRTTLGAALAAALALMPVSRTLAGDGDLVSGSAVFDNAVSLIVTDADGRPLVSGGFNNINGGAASYFAKLDSGGGSVDYSFGATVNSPPMAMAGQLDGKVLVGGNFTTANSTTRNRMARFNADGTLDTSFDPNVNGIVTAIAVQDDGKVLIGGSFTTVGGVSQPYLARLDATTGALDTSYTPTLSSSVSTFALQGDGNLLVCGYFTTVNSTTRNRMARLDSSGALDSTFNPSLSAAPTSIAIRPDGQIFINNGYSSTYPLLDGVTGAADTSFSTVLGGQIILQADGKILVNSGTITRLNSDGSTDNTYPSPVGYATINAVALVPGKLMTVGSFSDPVYGGENMAAYDHSGGDVIKVPDGSTVQWLRPTGVRELEQVYFQYRAPSTTTWTTLGSATRIGTLWELTGITVPSTGTLRAIGRTSGGISGSPSLLSSSIALPPDIQVYGNVSTITDGDTTPSPTDGTQFGSIAHTGGTEEHIFQVYNVGGAPLTITGASVSGAHAGDFAIGGLSLPVVLARHEFVNLTITFQPSATGSRTGTVELISDDPNESPFTFDLQGTGINPEVGMKYFGTSITDGDTTPSSGEGTLFADTQVVGGTSTRTLTIHNTGTDPLHVEDVLVEGGDSGDFIIVPIGFTLPFDLAASDSRNFNVTFNPTAVGLRATTVKVTTNDADEAEFDFAVEGTGVAPEVHVTGLGVTILDGDNSPVTTDDTHFGNVTQGTYLEHTFTIHNTGMYDLEVTATTFTNGHPGDFSITGSSTASIPPGFTDTMTVRFTPQARDLRTTRINFTTNDIDESNYDFWLRGYGMSPEIDVRGDGVSIADGDVTTQELDLTNFGKAATVSEAVPGTFTIHNTGNDPLNISSIALSTGTHFTLDASGVPGAIAAGGNASFTVTYDPSAAGAHSDTVQIVTNDLDEAAYDFLIEGTGVITGVPFTTFDPDPNGHVYSTAVQLDGKHIVGGLFATIGGSTTSDHIARLLAGTTHTVDTGFVPPVLASGDNVYCSAVLPDGKVLIGGNFSFVAGGKTWNRLARLNADGTIDTTFTLPTSPFNPPNPNLPVNAISVQKDGRILVAGQFTSISGVTAASINRVARLKLDNTVDTSFTSPNPGAEVWSMALTDDEQIVIAGAFLDINGTKDRVALLSNAGAVQSGFAADVANGIVHTAAIQADGKIVLAGSFTTINATTRNRIARVDGTTGALDSYNPNISTASSFVYSTVIQSDQRVIAGGTFTVPYNRIARFDTAGTADSNFNPNVSAGTAPITVFGLALHKDGTLLTGGNFTTIGGQTHTNLALVENNHAFEELNVTNNATRVEWIRGGSTPETHQVFFERLDGSEWVPLVGATGAGSRIGTTSNWEITGLSIPYANTTVIRARGRVYGGRANGSSGLAAAQISYYSTFSPGPKPSIIVSEPVSTSMGYNSTRDFGTLYYTAGSTVAPNVKTFRIFNSGNATMNDIAVNVTGAHPGDFTVSAPGATSLAPSTATTFTVSFAPTGTGARSAALKIHSNVTGYNPFHVNLTGTGDPTAFTATYNTGAEVPITASSFTATGKTITFDLNYAPLPGTELMVMNNTGLGAISGTFTGLAQWQTVTLTHNSINYDFVIHYFGGNGNDIVLIRKDRRLFAWGGNSWGERGDDNYAQYNQCLPLPIPDLGDLAGKSVVSVATGATHSAALCTDGTVVIWGDNYGGWLGTGGTNNTPPTAVDTSSGSALNGRTVVAIAVGGYRTLALCSDNTLVAWGSGQLGHPTISTSAVPIVTGRTTGSALVGRTIIAIAAGGTHNLALCSDGTVAAWGVNSDGQIGDNTITNRTIPVAINQGAGSSLLAKAVIAISAASSHSVALCSDGSVHTWGDNTYGELGINDPMNLQEDSPVAVATGFGVSALFGKAVVAVSAGNNHMLALCSDGTLASWGSNWGGCLGDTTTTTRYAPVAVNAASGVSALFGKTPARILASNLFSQVLCTDGTLVSWGSNQSGRVGANDIFTGNITAPVAVDTTALTLNDGFVGLATGNASHAMAISAGSAEPGIVVGYIDGNISYPTQYLAGPQTSVPFYDGLPMPFEITNTGTQNLTDFVITTSGSNPATFIIDTTGMATSLAPGEKTTFTVTMDTLIDPTGHSAVLQVESNSPTNNPYNVDLYYGY